MSLLFEVIAELLVLVVGLLLLVLEYLLEVELFVVLDILVLLLEELFYVGGVDAGVVLLVLVEEFEVLFQNEFVDALLVTLVLSYDSLLELGQVLGASHLIQVFHELQDYHVELEQLGALLQVFLLLLVV